MDKTTIIGIPLAIVAVIVAIILKGVQITTLLNTPAFLIIFGGTAAALLVSYPLRDIKKLPKLFSIVFKEGGKEDLGFIIKKMVGYSDLIRREGVNALESDIENVENAFLKKGILLLIEGLKGDEIREVLEEDMLAMEERHAANRGIFTQAGTYAPALGVMGAVFGLMAALAHMANMEKLSHGIIAAFVATVFGIFSAYVLWHPFANKLKRKSEEEVIINIAILEGVIALYDSKPSSFVTHKLLSYLPYYERDVILKEIKDGKAKE